MLATTTLISFIAQYFTRDLRPHAHQQNGNIGIGATIDFYESLYLPNPHYKINYIFEQKRINEDPEIEEIEEEIGKYMHYQPSTTTTTTKAVTEFKPEDINENFKDATNHGAFESPLVKLKTHQENQREATLTLAPIPPAPEL